MDHRMTTLHSALAALALGVTLSAAAARADAPPGLVELHVADPIRPLGGMVWYPAQPGGAATLAGDNKLFVGSAAVRGATPSAGRFPLVLISHGFGGNAFNQNWLAVRLAGAGMIVAAINHPGSTTGDVSPHAAMELWKRPADVSRTISGLAADPLLGPHIDIGRIAVIGHSLGGYTALAVAGVRMDRDRLSQYCIDHDHEGCDNLIRHADLPSLPREKFDGDERDERVSAVVAMAPGPVPAMTEDSLAAVTIPVMVIGGEHDTIIPAAQLRAMAARLRSPSVLLEIPGAAHFDFLPSCKPGGAELLREVHDDPICDGVADRAALQADLAVRIARFLEDAWPRVELPSPAGLMLKPNL